jgi:formamidopyrimidine-DNA glycosylase
MPELPEVEVARRCLEPELMGRRITEVDVRRQRMLRRQAHPVDFASRLLGRRVDRLDRHGKFLLAHVSGDLTWVTHLGMSGRVATATTGDVEPAHTNVVIRFDTGREFRLVDPRTFGFVAALTPAEVEASPLGRLGPDALSALPPSRQLGSVLSDRRAPIKALLLDQRVIAGLGNIYADEALHRAGIAPHRPAGDLAPNEIVRHQGHHRCRGPPRRDVARRSRLPAAGRAGRSVRLPSPGLRERGGAVSEVRHADSAPLTPAAIGPLVSPVSDVTEAATRALTGRIEGRVQGVGFRWSAKRRADELGVSGWVRNRPDGAVEVWIQGPDDAVGAMEAWLRHGPAGARVRATSLHAATADARHRTFRIV